MRFIKLYESFEEDKYEQIKDIFINIRDCELKVSNVFAGISLSIGNKKIVTDYNKFGNSGNIRSLSVRLVPVVLHNFYIDDNLFDELRSSIGHLESELELELNNIYLRTPSGIWFNSVDSMEDYIKKLPEKEKRIILKLVAYLDIVFDIGLNNDLF